ncbi:ATPase of the PP-loop superfamily [Cenarchaeum symbiosum A]|uniref:ATPase of the PP-loop superfamily n=1 Tax=Cenarchaeum symbiosum (strain A) TaxID=414004 RepID=A0RTN8_CENSY|nr:ATPase of the PP-loop superfamily [Cenarchaeum symbiosum A]
MIGRGDRVAVGVSGGKDSLVLLHILEQMSQKWGFELEAVTIDEGIPGYRDEALSIVEEYCGSLGVAHRVYAYKDLFDMTLDEALNMRGENSQTSCSICGTLRRRAMDHAIHDTGADVLATAHNLDDTLQTFLINMISGDTDRIAWMDPDTSSNELRKIKPFCEIYESEIVFYAFANKIPFQAESCPHMDEGIRTELRIFLNSLEESHSGAKNSLYRSVMKVTEALRPEVHKERQQCPGCGNSCTGGVCSVCRTISGLRGTAQGEAPGTA